MITRVGLRGNSSSRVGTGRARGVRWPGVCAVLALAVVGSMLAPAATAYAAPGDVVISELMFNPPSGVDGDEFLELTNTGATAVDLSGWCFSGITLCFGAGTSVPAAGRLVVGRDAARFQLQYGFAPAAVYTGGLSNGGETITLRDAAAAVIDAVTYSDRDPWPTTTDGTGPSLELIDPLSDNNDPVNWAASTAPVGQHARGRQLRRGDRRAAAHLRRRGHPNVPTANQAVTVTATITGQTGAVVRSQTDFGAQLTTPMTPTGGNSYAATIPGAGAGHLIRYRVEATNAAGTNYSPRAGRQLAVQGCRRRQRHHDRDPGHRVVHSRRGLQPDDRQPHHRHHQAGRPRVQRRRLRQHPVQHPRASRHRRSRRSAGRSRCRRITTSPSAGLVEPVDEFAMNADWIDNSHGRPTLAWDSYATAGVVNEQVMQLRVQKNTAFYGLYTYLDLFDGTWRDREGYSDKQFFKAGHGAFDATRQLVELRWEKKNPDDEDFTTISAVPGRRRPDRHRPAEQPAGHRRHPRDDQLRGRDRDRPAHRLEQQELLPQPGPGDRALVDHPLGPRPHVRKHVLRGDQPVRHPGRTGGSDQRADARDPRRPGVEADVLPAAAHRGQLGAGAGAPGGGLRREGHAGGAGVDARLRQVAAPGQAASRSTVSGLSSSPQSRPVAPRSPTTPGSPATRAPLRTSSSTRSSRRRRPAQALRTSSCSTPRPPRPSTCPVGRSPEGSTCASSRAPSSSRAGR